MSQDTWTISMLGVHVTLDELPILLGEKVTITPAKGVQVPVYNRYTGEKEGTETITHGQVLTFHHADGAEDVEGSWSQASDIEDQLERLLGLEVSVHTADGVVYGYAIGWNVADTGLSALRAAIDKAEQHGPILGKDACMMVLECSSD